MFLNSNIFSSLNYNCSNLLDPRNLKEQVKKAFCYQTLFWPFTVRINCSNDLKMFANSQPSAWNFKSFSVSLEQFLFTVGQNNFGNKIPFLPNLVLQCMNPWEWLFIHIFLVLAYVYSSWTPIWYILHTKMFTYQL